MSRKTYFTDSWNWGEEQTTFQLRFFREKPLYDTDPAFPPRLQQAKIILGMKDGEYFEKTEWVDVPLVFEGNEND